MSNPAFDQTGQKVGTQFNAGNITIDDGPMTPAKARALFEARVKNLDEKLIPYRIAIDEMIARESDINIPTKPMRFDQTQQLSKQDVDVLVTYYYRNGWDGTKADLESNKWVITVREDPEKYRPAWG